MGIATAVLVGLAATQVGTSIAAGYEKKKEANYNASLLEESASQYDVQTALIEKDKQLDLYQTNRQIGQVMGKTTANIGKSGVTLSGSPMAVMLDTYTQMEIDKRVSQSNFDIQKYNVGVEKSRTLSQAKEYRRQGKRAVFQGYTNAFTTALQTGVNYDIYSGNAARRASNYNARLSKSQLKIKSKYRD